MPRRAKIVATLGPATRDEAVLARLLNAGVDIVRLNLSHGTQAEHRELIHRVRKLSGEQQLFVPIIADLMGPRFRLGTIEDAPRELVEGQTVVFGRSGVGVDLPVEEAGFLHYLKIGERILIDNGLVELEMLAREDDRVKARVLVGGPISTRKGINLPDTDLPFSISEKDQSDIRFAVEEGVDYLAVSFVGGPDDLEAVREMVKDAGGNIPLIAKLERATAVRRHIERTIQTTDAVMVARGDLGVEVPLRDVPILQKKIIDYARRLGRPVIVATQMLESMMHHPRPTRAESTDVANAVIDGADALMLSGETAAGAHPIKVVQTMAEIINAAEAYQPQSSQRTRAGGPGVLLDPLLTNLSNASDQPALDFEIPDMVAASAVYATRRLPVRHIVAFSHSGFTAQMISRYRPEPPITVFTRDPVIARRVQLWWGTRPWLMEHKVRHHDQVVDVVDRMLLENDLARPGDCIIILMGDPIGSNSLTNLMRIHRVRPHGAA